MEKEYFVLQAGLLRYLSRFHMLYRKIKGGMLGKHEVCYSLKLFFFW